MLVFYRIEVNTNLYPLHPSIFLDDRELFRELTCADFPDELAIASHL
jgi:hypothetical protein